MLLPFAKSVCSLKAPPVLPFSKLYSSLKALQCLRWTVLSGLSCELNKHKTTKSSPTQALTQFASSRVISHLFILLLQVAECDDQSINEQRENFVERVHEATLHPLGDSDSSVGEAQLLQNIVGPDRIDLCAGPVKKSASRSPITQLY